MITAAGINLIEGYIRSIISHVEVRVGGTWHKAASTDVSIVTNEDKVMILATVPKSVAAGATIEEVRVVAVSGDAFCQKNVSIKRSSNSTGVMYSCEIFITTSEITG